MLISVFNANHTASVIVPASTIIPIPNISIPAIFSFIIMPSTSSIIASPSIGIPNICSIVFFPFMRLPSISSFIVFPSLIFMTVSEIRNILVLVTKSIRYRCIIVVIRLAQNIAIVLTTNDNISTLILTIESIIPFLCEFISIELLWFLIRL